MRGDPWRRGCRGGPRRLARPRIFRCRADGERRGERCFVGCVDAAPYELTFVLRDEAGVVTTGGELRVRREFSMKAEIGANAGDAVLAERAREARQRRGSVG